MRLTTPSALLLALGLALSSILTAGISRAIPKPEKGKTKTLTLERVDREPRTRGKPPGDKELGKLSKRLADAPTDRERWFDLVRALMTAEKWDEALAKAREWRQQDAYNLVVVRLIGDILSELGRHQEARRAYSAVVELLPEDAPAHRALASVLKESGDLDGAYRRLSVAARLQPNDQRIAFELADAAQRLGRTDEAVQRFRRIIEADDVPSKIAYPAKQRLAQILASQRLAALKANDESKASELLKAINGLKVKGGVVNDIKVYLTWDTNRSDVDLWVINPRGEKVFYSHKRGRFGGALFDDVTSGYGPESFTARQAAKGAYTIKVHYYASDSRRFTAARGEVVVVLNEGTEREQRHVLPYRLFKQKDVVTVARIKVAEGVQG